MPRVRLAKPPTFRGPGASGSMSMAGSLYRFSCRSSRTEACWAHGLRRSVECSCRDQNPDAIREVIKWRENEDYFPNYIARRKCDGRAGNVRTYGDYQR